MRKAVVVRLIVAAVLFAAWIGYLGYLALTASKPVVLSRPQFLIADLVVIAQVNSPDDLVEVREVRPGDLKLSPKIRVRDLKEWKTAGTYILPLTKDGDEYRVVPIPDIAADAKGEHRIYPVTDDTRAQLKQIFP